MMRMMLHLELLLNDVGNAFPSPQIGRKPGSLCAIQKNTNEFFPLFVGQFGRSSVGRLRSQSFESIALNDLLPPPHRRCRCIQRLGDFDILLACKKKTTANQTASLLLRLASKCSFHIPSCEADYPSVHYFSEGQ
jgi:hypothetical protein